MKKRAVSLLVSYVLLILLTVSLAGLIYGFLQYRAKLPEKIECPEGVSVYVINFSCNTQNNKITFWIKNNGLWNISGINVKVYASTGVCNGPQEIEKVFGPGDLLNGDIQINGCNPNKLEILPYIITKPEGKGPAIKGKKVYCSKARIKVDVSC